MSQHSTGNGQGTNHRSLADRIAALSDRVVLEPFAFAITLSVVAMLAALVMTEAGPLEVVEHWGDGLQALLAFVAQMALMVLFCHALAHVGPMPKLLRRLARVPKTESGARVYVCLFTAAVSLIAWPIGLIVGAVMVRAVIESFAERRQPLASVPLAACGFSGYVVWHMGYSASAPLFVATEGNAMQEQLGGLIPITLTLLAPFNLVAIALTVTAVTLVSRFASGSGARSLEDETPSAAESVGASEAEPVAATDDHHATLVERVATARWPSTLMGLLVASYLGLSFSRNLTGLDLNLVNWTFLGLGLLLARSPTEYSAAIANAGRTAAPLLLLYPLYSGVMGLMLNTGLVAQVSTWVAGIATAQTLPLLGFLSAAVINLFVPSGGAQWAVQGPAFIEAAKATGTDFPLIVMSVAYGDQWTNLIHPFVVIPFALISKVEGKRILGGAFLMFLAAGASLILSLLLASLWP